MTTRKPDARIGRPRVPVELRRRSVVAVPAMLSPDERAWATAEARRRGMSRGALLRMALQFFRDK